MFSKYRGVNTNLKVLFLRKRLFTSFIFLMVLIYLIFLIIQAGYAKDKLTETFFLTDNEKVWLSEHKQIVVGFDGYFPPYSYFNSENQLTGIAVEKLQLIEKKLQVKFVVSDKFIWQELYQAGLDKEVDIIATMVERPKRHEFFNFTSSYIEKPLAIISYKDDKQIASRSDLNGKVVALVKDYQYSNQIVTDYPDLIPFYVQKMEDAMVAVDTQKADAAIIYLAGALYIQAHNNIQNIKFAAHYDYQTSNESIAVRKDWPILATILQKALENISDVEQQQIDEKWNTTLKVPVDYKVLIQFSLFFFVLISMLAGWIYQVKRRNKKIKRTQEKLAESNLALSHLTNTLEKQVIERTDKLTRSEKRYHNLVENLYDDYFFYQRDLHGNYSYISPSITNLLGYTPTYFIENAVNIFTNNSINQKANELSFNNHGSNKSTKFEIELCDKSGENHQFMIVENAMRDSENNQIGVEGIAQDITSLTKTQAQLNWLSYFDDLTQLANRRLFLVQFEQLINVAHRNNETLALIFLDLNRFKIINDNLGHLSGDEVLKESAIRIKSALRESDIAARIGGDEFTVILPENNAYSAEQVAQKLLTCLQLPFVINEKNYVLGASIGISLYPQNGIDATTLIKQADSAMYFAKQNKLGYSFCSPDQVRANSRHLQIEQQLRIALSAKTFDDNFEFSTVYQPKVLLNQLQVNGYEALIRWNHPELGSISPHEFIPIAEEAGIIHLLTEWMIENVCRQLIQWHETGFDFGKVAVNVSAVELLNLQLADNLIAIIKRVGAMPEWIEIEVTESALIKAPEIAVTVLNKLAKYNILVAIDDFGTGYSSLSYLKNIPAAYIKIDKSFIDNVLDNQEDKEVVRAIIAMSHALGKLVIAEGVETEEQLAYLHQQQCDIVQGYWYSKPVSAIEIVNLKAPTLKVELEKLH